MTKEYLREFRVLSGRCPRLPGLTEKSEAPQEYDSNVKTVANALLKAAIKLNAPKGFGTFGATYLDRMRQVQLLFDVPVQVIDPKQYPPESKTNDTLGHWTQFLKEIEHLLAEYRRKYPDVAILKRRQPDDAESEIIARAKPSRLK